MIKLYISGRITGNKNYRAEFDRAKRFFETSDFHFTVINPAVLPKGLTNEDYMRICFAMIDSSDAVAFLPGWETSPGARLERAYCEYVHKATLECPDL